MFPFLCTNRILICCPLACPFFHVFNYHITKKNSKDPLPYYQITDGTFPIPAVPYSTTLGESAKESEFSKY